MPTFTRLAAMVLFGALTYFIGLRYQLLYDDPPRSLMAGSLFLAGCAAFVGWTFVGPRIDKSYFRAFTVVIQGYLATLLLALFFYGFYDAFTQGYAMRYKDFGDAFQGVMRAAIDHLTRMLDRDFLLLVGGIAVIITLVVTTVFRMAEARRTEY
ncbi:MAG: TrgA family protein [Natronohydrobacter sp.]|nr:TrgA family protein [Natronohydrobacter sp.]